MLFRTLAIILGAATLGVGCSPLGTKGRLHAVPSVGSDLPFQTGFYVVDGAPEACDLEVDYVIDSPPTMGRFMAFADDGTFVLGRDERAVRAGGSSNSYEAWPGNYRVDGDTVKTRVVGPGGDTMYRRTVRAYDVRATGPRSFVKEWSSARFSAGEGEETGCGIQRYILSDAVTG